MFERSFTFQNLDAREGGGGADFLVVGSWVCAAGWGRIFTTFDFYGVALL